MPRNLKLYITGVVTLSAIALVVATRLFPPESRIALTFAVGNIPGVTVAAGEPSQLQILAGIAFWTLVTLLASACPRRASSRVPSRGCPRANRGGDVVGRSCSGGLGRGDRYHRNAGASRTNPVVRIAHQPRRGNPAGRSSVGWFRFRFAADFGTGRVVYRCELCRNGLGAIVLVGLNVAIASGLLALRTGQSFASVLTVDSREAVFSSLALAPLGWLMAIIYSIQALATLLFALAPVHDTTSRPALDRDARDVHPDDRGAWLRPLTRGIRSRRGIASGSRRSLSTSVG